MKVLWSFGKNDPDQESFTTHGRNKGAKTLYLTGKMTKKPLSNRIKHWDVTVKNVSIYFMSIIIDNCSSASVCWECLRNPVAND